MKTGLFLWCGIVFWMFLFPQTLRSQPSAEALEHFWQTDGPVYAIVPTNGLVHLGGDFSYVGPVTGGVGLLDPVNAQPDRSFPKVLMGNGEAGVVSAAAADGNGGWFIAGTFASVGGVARTNLAHILSDNRVDPAWDPAPNGANSSMVLAGNTLYISGAFTRIGGQARNRIAALDAVTGQATLWNPNLNQPALAMSFAGNALYVGGNFTAVGNQARSRLAALDIATGQPTAWNPNANQIVSALAVAGNVVYAGGNFTTVGGKPRNRIAALDAVSGLALDWNPNASGAVNALAVTPTAVYAAGAFNAIGSQNRNRFAELDPVTGLATALSADVNGAVNSLLLVGTTLYFGGAFTAIGPEARRNIGAVDTVFGNVTDWAAPVSSLSPAATMALTLASSQNRVLVGGNFRSIGGVIRSNIAVLNGATGEATAWKADANDTVVAVAVTSDRVYAGGIFTSISGAARNRIAALDPVSGAALNWNPGISGRANSVVNVILPIQSRVFVGGAFTNVAGSFRNSLAAIDASSGTASAWDPNVQALQTTISASVQLLQFTGDLIYVGGDFVRVGGQVRPRVAAVSPATGQPTSFSVNTSNIVAALAMNQSTLYLGGTFTSLGGQVRNRLGAVDLGTAQVSAWNPDASGQNARINALAILGTHAYSGGQFTSTGGEFRNRLAALDLATGQASNWDPNLDGLVRTIQITPDAIYVAGDFLHVGGTPQSYFVVFSNQPTFDSLSVVNNQFKANLRTGEGQNVRIQTSTDLSQWTDLKTEAVSGAPVALSEPVSAAPARRFYRAVLAIEP